MPVCGLTQLPSIPRASFTFIFLGRFSALLLSKPHFFSKTRLLLHYYWMPLHYFNSPGLNLMSASGAKCRRQNFIIFNCAEKRTKGCGLQGKQASFFQLGNTKLRRFHFHWNTPFAALNVSSTIWNFIWRHENRNIARTSYVHVVQFNRMCEVRVLDAFFHFFPKRDSRVTSYELQPTQIHSTKDSASAECFVRTGWDEVIHLNSARQVGKFSSPC